MSDMRDMIYHANLQQIRRVLNAMGSERIEQGLTAFDNGASNWNQCFFARAFPEFDLSWTPEGIIMQQLGIPSPVPIRIVYQTFDGVNKGLMTKNVLRTFIEAVLDERRPQEVLNVIRSINYDAEEEIIKC